MADRISDRYVIVEQIGVGGMGTVYRAHDTTIERDVALKWLPGHFSADPTFVQRFRREARVVARLEHPHIVPIYDVGEHESRPYIVMRLLTGGTLRERLKSSTYTLGDFQQAMQQVADALRTAHAQGIVHRDIKPGNLLFDEHGSIFLSDFGIAKVIDAATQLTGSGFIGTPAYMSPEQFRGDAIDGRSDQYALAIVVYEALSGNLPFQGDTAQMMYKHLSTPPPPVDLADVPSAFDDVLQKALSKNPQERYPTISEFVAALQQATAGSSAASATLPLQGRQRAVPTVLAGTAAAQAPKKTIDNLADEYRQGLQAMAAYDWAAAVAAFDRVLSADPSYGNAADFREQALSLMAPLPADALRPTSEVAMTAAATAAATMAQTRQASPQTAPFSQPAVTPTAEKRGLPLAVIGGAIIGLLLIAAVAFLLLSRGGDEEPAVAAVTAEENTAVILPATEGDDGQVGGADVEQPPAESDNEAPAIAATLTSSPTETSSPTVEPSATATAPPPTETAVLSAAAAASGSLPTATATAAVPPTVRVTVSSANVRQGPGTVYPQIGIVTEGQILSVLARDTTDQWYNIEMPNEELAWIAASVVEAVDGAALNEIEVAATIPAAPTATRVPPTATRPPATVTVAAPPPPPPDNGGGSGGNNGGGSGGNDGGSSPPPVYTAEPP